MRRKHLFKITPLCIARRQTCH